jgi:hypothetical protein
VTDAIIINGIFQCWSHRGLNNAACFPEAPERIRYIFIRHRFAASSSAFPFTSSVVMLLSLLRQCIRTP